MPEQNINSYRYRILPHLNQPTTCILQCVYLIVPTKLISNTIFQTEYQYKVNMINLIVHCLISCQESFTFIKIKTLQVRTSTPDLLEFNKKFWRGEGEHSYSKQMNKWFATELQVIQFTISCTVFGKKLCINVSLEIPNMVLKNMSLSLRAFCILYHTRLLPSLLR